MFYVLQINILLPSLPWRCFSYKILQVHVLICSLLVAACGSEYDSYEYLCCDGVPWRRGNDVYDSCCGTKPYKRGYYMCCGGYVIYKDNFGHCCESMPYLVIAGTHLCCDGVLREKGIMSQECCGTRPYSRSSYLCCNTYLYPTSLGYDACCGRFNAYKTSASICCGGVVVDKNGMDCCQGWPYRTNSQICCGRYIYPKGNNDACCDTIDGRAPIPYSSIDEICCDGHVQARPSGYDSCCGTVAHPSLSTVCCDDRVRWGTRCHP